MAVDFHLKTCILQKLGKTGAGKTDPVAHKPSAKQ